MRKRFWQFVFASALLVLVEIFIFSHLSLFFPLFVVIAVLFDVFNVFWLLALLLSIIKWMEFYKIQRILQKEVTGKYQHHSQLSKREALDTPGSNMITVPLWTPMKVKLEVFTLSTESYPKQLDLYYSFYKSESGFLIVRNKTDGSYTVYDNLPN